LREGFLDEGAYGITEADEHDLRETWRVPKSEEDHLVSGLIRRDEAAWERFCRLYAHPLFGFVRYALRLDAETAEDVVQATLLRCVRSIATFDSRRGDLLGWLKAIARNESHTFLKRGGDRAAERPFAVLPPSIVEEILETLDQGDLPEEVLARRDLQLLVQEVLISLVERQRRVLVMKYVEELRVAEIASHLSVSEKAVESLLSRAREAFRVAFQQKASKADARTEVRRS
jgi:RNA polymerase sigma-70 factor (ECF subfamily)